MSVVRSASDSSAGDIVRGWLPVGLRALAVVMLLPAGAMKFLQYGARVAFFTHLGIPAASTMVVVVGVVELAAAVAFALGAASRLAALAVVPVMVTAMAVHAVAPSNVAVVLASVGIVALGPGRFALRPESGPVDWLSR